MYLTARTSSEPASAESCSTKLRHPPSACDFLHACVRERSVCALLISTIMLQSPITQPRHRQAHADQNILCTERLP
jgi:hypothetical protein